MDDITGVLAAAYQNKDAFRIFPKVLRVHENGELFIINAEKKKIPMILKQRGQANTSTPMMPVKWMPRLLPEQCHPVLAWSNSPRLVSAAADVSVTEAYHLYDAQRFGKETRNTCFLITCYSIWFLILKNKWCCTHSSFHFNVTFLLKVPYGLQKGSRLTCGTFVTYDKMIFLLH